MMTWEERMSAKHRPVYPTDPVPIAGPVSPLDSTFVAHQHVVTGTTAAKSGWPDALDDR